MKKYILAAILAFFALCCCVECAPCDTLGERLNNPGLLRPNNPAKWPGYVGVTPNGYIAFEKPIDGIRAIVIVLKKYRDKHKIFTVRKIVLRYTSGENHKLINYANYIRCVSKRLGVKPDEALNLWDAKVLCKLVRALIYFENGRDVYDVKLYQSIFPKVKIERMAD